MSDCIVFFSGGMDSLIHLKWAQLYFDRVHALFVNFNHSYASNELEAARDICKRLGTDLVELSFPLGQFEQEDSFLPLRNLYLLELGSHFSDNLVFGMLYHEGPPDKRPRFVKKMERLLNSQLSDKKYFTRDREIKIHTPFAYKTKTQMLRWFLRYNRSRRINLVLETVGCYSPTGHCGQCISCFNRWVALTNNHMAEDYKYSPVLWAGEQLVLGKKKRQNLVSLYNFWYKGKYIKEIYSAMSLVMDDPFRKFWRVYRNRDLRAFKLSLFKEIL